jgi:electron transfer flavoprotein-quinone oxidoreductase
MPRLQTHGLMIAGDAAALCFVAGLYLEGINYAIHSGLAAGEVAVQAHQDNDFSDRSLSRYKDALTKRHVLRDFRSFRTAPHFVNSEQMQNLYPEIVNHLTEQVFTNQGQPKLKLVPLAIETLRGLKVSIWRILKDIYVFWRALGW